MVKKYKYINVLYENYELKNKKVLIWGISVSALTLFTNLKSRNIHIIGFTDSFVQEHGGVFAGLPVFTFDEVKALGEVVIYVSTNKIEYQRQILEKTCALDQAVVLAKGTVYGCGEYDIEVLRRKIEQDKKEISFVRESLCDEKSRKTFDNLIKYRISNDVELISEVYENSHMQYFPVDEIIEPEIGGVFIDAGAYNGRTSGLYAKWNPNYEKIYMMEPDETMYLVASEYVKLTGIENVIRTNKGAYSCQTELAFHNNLGSSKIDECGENKIKTISIDEMLNGEKATFIKMDIEGAEMEALKGAEKTIMKYRPILAISIYHKEDDLWKIPYYIKKKYSWYKLYIRHYTRYTTETILYATV